MQTPNGPGHDGGNLRGLVIALVVLATVAAAIAVWLLLRRPPEGPKGPPPAPRARNSPPSPPSPPSPTAEIRATPRPELPEPRPAAPAPTLRVDADVPGANVFLDRKFLGTTPVEARGMAPGPHRLNVSAGGYEMYGETVELHAGPNEVTIRFKEVRLDERIDVVHKHGMGSCRGRLVATPAGLRYETDRAGESFDAPLASLEPLQVDYLKKNLRVRQRGGRTWNFSSDSADALLAFQQKVEKARERLSS
ncbi:MAG TPA: PEGA domain-containing protein [Vicinamibacteria bacterium]|nr:PEGA domain-containing protein [Vicinamibacteria bacterium]